MRLKIVQIREGDVIRLDLTHNRNPTPPPIADLYRVLPGTRGTEPRRIRNLASGRDLRIHSTFTVLWYANDQLLHPAG